MNKSDLFKEDMRRNGFDPLGTICTDGKFHRFHIGGDKSVSKNGYYSFFDNGTIALGIYGSWKTGIRISWNSRGQGKMTTEEKVAYQEIQQQRSKEEKHIHAECREKVATIWKRATKEGISEHPYVVRKEIKPVNVRIDKNNNLLVPIRGIDKTLHGLQFIKPDGTKKFMTGTAIKGNFILLGKEPEKASALIICEGWATGCSLRQATKLPVVVALNVGNLKAVAEVWRAMLPDMKIVIASDDDHETDGNPGKKYAIEAAKVVNGITAFPDFADAAGKTDFNDMHQEQELDAVKEIIMEACSKEPDDENTWAEPILFGSINTPDIPSSLLPEPLAGYCKAVAEHTQTPSGLSVMTVLATVATCSQKRFEVSPYGDEHSEPTSIMSVTALESGTRKSAVVYLSTAPLVYWEKEQEEKLKDEAAEVQHKRDMLKRSIEAIKSKASKLEVSEEERAEALSEIKSLEESMPEEIIIPKLFVDDVTVEKLGVLLSEQGERMSVFSDEGGFFEVVSGLYTGGNSNVNIVLQSHAGSAVRVQRMGRSVMLTKPALTLGLAVQPDIVASLATGNKTRFRHNGMLARFLYCIPESTVGSRDVSKRKAMPESVIKEYHKVIHGLLAVKPLKDEFGKEKPRILTLSSKALALWVKFSQRVENKQGKFGEYYSIRDWTCKLPGAVLRIAGLCHVVEYGTSKKNRVINKGTIRRTIKLANLLILHAKVAFGMMGCDQAISDAKFVFQWITDNGVESFCRGDLHRALHGRFQRVERLKSALSVLIERHIVSEPEEHKTGRRPKIVYMVNPAVLKGGAEEET